ncbi:circadian clock KaiB family protein [Dyadobacter fanqingshengii]|uniref:Circadian clock KaiB family protein n=1 Tax=Dyadobacter fanqingshengii TaxID=2906443 RepID=A0A9X1P7F8_9BACT|nr:circadian clock KaiB family protein [Dyadobacter fanqingshengii]MCF0040141.1 circadian clock KaiB family protein [Dyadobacter fanqingshengii]MCF2502370.1 circadian clock KaiB family protein [Dyadobacter fanqingshengii]USJ38107.1 circadian clock KaiB family protein [Dyadobacter fanqingshengii]
MTGNTDTEPNDQNDDDDHYVLRLFVTGASLNSRRAVVNIKEICETYMKGKYSLEIVDVYQQKTIAEQEQIIALPLLIKSAPLPARRLIGDMSDTQKVLRGLGISIET